MNHCKAFLFFVVFSLLVPLQNTLGQAGPERGWSKPFRPGLRGIAELGYFGIGGGNYEELKLGLSLGYQANQYFLTGLGSGARISLENDDKITFPLFAFLRVSTVERKFTPYLAMGIGNFYDWNGRLEKVGLFLSSTLGARMNLTHRTAVYLGLGIEIQNERWTSNNSAGVNLGMIF